MRWTSRINYLLFCFFNCELLLALQLGGSPEAWKVVRLDFKVLQTPLWSISIYSLQNHPKIHPPPLLIVSPFVSALKILLFSLPASRCFRPSPQRRRWIVLWNSRTGIMEPFPDWRSSSYWQMMETSCWGRVKRNRVLCSLCNGKDAANISSFSTRM